MVNELVKNVHFYKLLELLVIIVKNIYQIIILTTKTTKTNIISIFNQM